MFVKLRNNLLSRHNFFVISGHRFYVTNDHKIRASMNSSYFIVKYLPQSQDLYYYTSSSFDHPAIFSTTKFPLPRTPLMMIISFESDNICWDGKQLSEILQRENQARVDVKVNLSTYCHQY